MWLHRTSRRYCQHNTTDLPDYSKVLQRFTPVYICRKSASTLVRVVSNTVSFCENVLSAHDSLSYTVVATHGSTTVCRTMLPREKSNPKPLVLTGEHLLISTITVERVGDMLITPGTSDESTPRREVKRNSPTLVAVVTARRQDARPPISTTITGPRLFPPTGTHNSKTRFQG